VSASRRTRASLRCRALAAAGLLGLTVTACSGTDSGDVESTARDFYRALDAHDGAGACRLLAPPTRSEVEQSAGKPCAQAIVEERIGGATGSAHVEVYGTMGQVRWSEETTFLTRYDDGWRVLAAGCALPARSTTGDTNDAGDPERYDCSVKN
jgi:hypothetical protein